MLLVNPLSFELSTRPMFLRVMEKRIMLGPCVMQMPGLNCLAFRLLSCKGRPIIDRLPCISLRGSAMVMLIGIRPFVVLRNV